MKNKLRVLLLGGSGFVGKHIVEKLSSKYQLITPTHTELNLLDEKKVEKIFSSVKPDVVLYCVNVGGIRKKADSAEVFEQNMRMFFNVTRCSKYFNKLIFLGSGAEYDKRINLIKVKETDFDTHVPEDYYGFYKYLCSKFIEKTDNIINLRVFGLFGPNEDYSLRFISNTICKSLYNLPLTINKNVLFEYVYIDDFMRIIDYFISHKVKYKFYNIGSGNPIDLITIANEVNNITKKKLKIIIKNRGLGNEYTCANTRLQMEMPNFTFTPFHTSLHSLYKWYTVNKKQIDKKKLLHDYK